MKIISLIGRAGCGKSTIGRMLAERMNYAYISTGDLARTLADKSWVKGGALAPEQALREEFLKAVNECTKKGIIVDGMPRIPDQVNFLNAVVDEVIFIEIYVPRHIAKERLLDRGRNDDTDVAIENRFKVFDDNIYGIVMAIAEHGNKFETYTNDGDVNIGSLISEMIEDIEQN